MTVSLSDIAKTTQDVYERNAVCFDAERSKSLFERSWLDRFLSLIPDHSQVLDAGCGSGDPIASYIIGREYAVTGVDASAAMLQLARERFPDGDWRQLDMRALDLSEQFHGILGWDSFFHLMQAEQRSVLPKFAAHLVPSGVLMLTVGPGDGEVTGRVGEDTVYHASLSLDEYRSILATNGMNVIDYVTEDRDCAGRTILLAQKQANQSDS